MKEMNSVPVAEQVEELLLQWEELREQGQPVAPEDLCRGTPELLPELRRRIAVLEAIYRIPNGSQDQTTLNQTQELETRELPTIPGYEILEVLGSGGMGKVYRARDLKLNRAVALKMIRAGAHASQDEIQRFRTEARAVAQLQHPNIVQIHEIGEHQGQAYLVLEYLEGGSLDKLLRQQQLTPRQAAELVEALARAMHYAHQRGILHRDLKPANILLQGSGERGQGSGRKPLPSAPSPLTPIPKVSDFGLAKRLDEELGQTRTGAVLGTPHYMAPEQSIGDVRALSPATDVHALGAILYECLTGKTVFRGETLLQTLEQVRTAEPDPPSRVRPEIPADLDTICLKCLEKVPQRRYASAGELADDLRRFLNGEMILARPYTLVDRLTRTLNRTEEIDSQQRIYRLSRVMMPVPFLLHGGIWWLLRDSAWYPATVVSVTLSLVIFTLVAFVVLFWHDWRRVHSGNLGYLWAVRIAQGIGMLALTVLCWLVEPRAAPWQFVVYAFWTILFGCTLFGLGRLYWGRLYLLGLGFVGLVPLMALQWELAPVVFGAGLSLFMFVINRHLRPT